MKTKKDKWLFQKTFEIVPPFRKNKFKLKNDPCCLIVDDLDNPKNDKKVVEQIKMFIKKTKPMVIDLSKLDK